MADDTKAYLAPAMRDRGFVGVTGTTPYRLASPQEVATLRQTYESSFSIPAARTAPAGAVVLSINFDGTHNNGKFPQPGESPTTIYRLSQLQEQAGDPRNVLYVPGVGAQTVLAGTLDANGFPAPGASRSFWDAVPLNAGAPANMRVEDAYAFIVKRVAEIRAENPGVEIVINVAGFSRGGAQTYSLANVVGERGIPGLFQPGEGRIHTLVTVEAVDQTAGRLDTRPPTNVDNNYALLAQNEGRAIMPAMPVGAGAYVMGLPGNHGDEGGLHNLDGVRAVSLGIVWNIQNQTGVPLAPIPQLELPNWDRMRIHDSSVDAYGNVLFESNSDARYFEFSDRHDPTVQEFLRSRGPGLSPGIAGL